jgi:hypothetical protein
MQRHPLLRQAAAVASTFSLDPVAVLRETDVHCKAARIAAHNAVIEMEKKAAEKAS